MNVRDGVQTIIKGFARKGFAYRVCAVLDHIDDLPLHAARALRVAGARERLEVLPRRPKLRSARVCATSVSFASLGMNVELSYRYKARG